MESSVVERREQREGRQGNKMHGKIERDEQTDRGGGADGVGGGAWAMSCLEQRIVLADTESNFLAVKQSIIGDRKRRGAHLPAWVEGTPPPPPPARTSRREDTRPNYSPSPHTVNRTTKSLQRVTLMQSLARCLNPPFPT